MSLRIYNTLARQLQVFTPIEPGHVRLYVCGLTVYDYCHIGHARANVAFDVVQRWLQVSGYKVTYVRNITDIDDKIIRRALENGESIRALTSRMIDAMHQDFDALNIERPNFEPRATDHVPAMLNMIQTLEQKGLAYRSNSVAGAGGEHASDVNLSIRHFPNYGQLSGKSLDDLRAGERVAVSEGKQDPLDPVLWKSAKPEEPDDAKWPSVFGPGRPGWHIECSAMACELLGKTLDIHGGGADLQFPHHETEIAQSEGANGQTFVNTWMHNGFINVDNEKMSKSLGNFFTIRDVLKSFDAETIRFFVVRAHYRSPLNYSDVHLKDARQSLRRLYTALDTGPVGEAKVASIDWSHPFAARFKAAMDEDFATPEAVAVLFDVASEINKANADKANTDKAQDATAATSLRTLLKALGACLGLLQSDPRAYLQGLLNAPASSTEAEGREAATGLSPAEIQAQIDLRTQAKKDKNFAEADRIRQGLLAQGIALKDSPSGTTWEAVP